MLVGVDIGGTFTDLVLSHNGQLSIHKLASTPHNPAEAMLAGLNAITGDLNAVQQIAHGSTVATNAILERNGARAALITTQGFRDVLFIGRQTRPELYALQPSIPAPLIPRERCYEIPERLDYRGDVLQALDFAALDAVIAQLVAQNVNAVAVCLLYSFVNPEHEQAIRERIVSRTALAAWQVALSSDVLPEFREYERASTTALEAYVRPVMVNYVRELADTLPAHIPLRIMKSDGGVMSASHVAAQAIHTALSGPAAGVIGAHHLATLAGYPDVITLDMGGTSTDVALCPAALQYAADSQIDGLPLRARLLDIETIGAGGGSIARLDAGGALRVGPQSAGAMPGPMVYGRGGEQLTVSDANALLGRLDAEHFLGGGMTLDLASAQQAMTTLAQHIQTDPQSAAQGIIDVANVNIERALRRVSVARGHDPRRFTLVAFGGAGPLHACEVAERLHISRVLIPRYPGVLCALGLLVADVVVEQSRAVLATLSNTLEARLRGALGGILAEARNTLQADGIPEDAITYQVTLDMRYRGQAHELNIAFTSGQALADAFHQAHKDAYGHALHDRPIDVVNLRVRAIAAVQRPEFAAAAIHEHAATPFDHKTTASGGTLGLYERDALAPGAYFSGEALLFQVDSTVYVAAGWSARVDAYRNLILERAD
jgi:N-methylhydantoinase A